jgi:hypothetical protein
MTEHNLPENDDAIWLDAVYDGFMTHEEMLEEAAKREKENEVLEIGKKCIEEYSEAMEKLAEIESQEFYRFFVIEYFGTGEGITYFLQISRNYRGYTDFDGELHSFKKFVDDDYYLQGMEELEEEEFMTKYAALIPAHVVKMVSRKDQPMLTWQTHFHVNYS